MSAQQEKFTEIADAIREKTGTTDLIKPSEFADKVSEVYDAGYEKGTLAAEPTTPTDNRTSMAYWYQYLAAGGQWNTYYDENNNFIRPTDDEATWLEEVEFPKGTQNVTDFENVFSILISDDLYMTDTFLPAKKYTGTLDMTSARSCRGMLKYFKGTTLENVILPDCSKITDFTAMFYGCNKLLEFPSIDTSNGTNFSSMYYYCSAMTIAPNLDLKKGTNFYSMYGNCKNLIECPEYDIRSATTLMGIISGCSSITTIKFKNIKTTLQIASGSSWGHKLTTDSLIYTIRELRDTGTTLYLTMGSTNLAKLANVYVRTIDITDEMRAEDDLIDEKLPFEICESTDEGATLITEYVKAKNWGLK